MPLKCAAMNACVFIHTNHKQMLGALVAQHALRRSSTNNDRFEVRIIDSADFDFLAEFDGQMYLRDGVKRVWLYDDLHRSRHCASCRQS